MSKTETIEEKTYRLVNEAHGNTFTSLTAALDNVAFAYTCKAIELVIAEEREACAGVAEAAGSDANKYDIADSIRARGDAQKDEVSE